MSDMAFPARLTVTRDVDLDGMPILTATVTPDPEAASLPLPPGPQGPQGAIGAARSTFVKAGTIASAAARPTGLTAEDRGRWWHRLDTDGMDVWTGTGWVHSPGAVGDQGPVAPAATVTTVTTHDPDLTTPAVRVTAEGADLTIAATVPAGLAGPPGPPGASGSIVGAEDYDSSTGATQRGMFALNLGGRRWSATPPPNGFGPWGWWNEADFTPDQTADADQLIALTATIPPLPFRWRPLCWGNLWAYCEASATVDVEVRVRLGSPTGVMVASGGGLRASTGQFLMVPFGPAYGDEGTKPLSPSSQYATVPPATPATLIVAVERVGTGLDIGYDSARGSLTVWAQPV